MQLRKLNMNEVEFSVKIDPEDSPLEHFDSGEPEEDDLLNAELRARVDRGDELAWCQLAVTAKWKNFQYNVYLGGCSFEKLADVQEEIEHIGMKEEALEGLQKKLQEVFETLHSLAQV